LKYIYNNIFSNKIIYINASYVENGKSGSKRLVFGLSLAEAIAASKIKANYELPAVVYRCIEYLDANDGK